MKRRSAIKQSVLTVASFVPIVTFTDILLSNNQINTKNMNLGILIYEKVEELDFVGPLEVFSVANDAVGNSAFNVFTVSIGDKKIKAVNNLQVIAYFSLDDCPKLDILLVPGGNGRKVVMNNLMVLDWIKGKYKELNLLLSVCTGAFIIGNAGLLKNKNATTNQQCYVEFKEKFPDTSLRENIKYVKDGNIVTSGGISAGIDMSLFVVGHLLGNEVALKTAALMEYDYNPS